MNEYEDKEPTEVDALLITHKYDKTCLYLTLSDFIDNSEFHKEYLELLDEMHKFMLKKSLETPDNMIPID